VPALPRNPTGKIQKMVLREPYWQNTERKIG
jgi:acyl-coenzyme A synthetase/AMP-(fatty) acid ligase